MAKEASIISDEVMGEIKSEGADGSIVHDLYELFLKSLESLSYEQLNQQLIDLKVKEMSGTLVESDFGLFKKINSMLGMRKKAIENNVAEVFTLAREGKTRQANLLAKKLVIERIDALPAGVISTAQKDQIELFAKQAIGVVKDQAAGDLKYDGSDENILNKLLAANEVRESGRNVNLEISQVVKVEEVQKENVRIAQVVEALDTVDVLNGIKQAVDENNEKSDRAAKPFDSKLVEKPNKALLKTRLKRSFRGRQSKDVLDDLLDNGPSASEALITQVQAGGKGKRQLERYRNSLKIAENALDEDKLIVGLSADHGKGITKKKVRLIIGGFDTGEVLPKSATKRQRLEKVLMIIGGENQPWSDDEKIDLIAQALNIPVAERIRAEKIWTDVKDWNKKYGNFRDKIEGLRYKIDETFNPVKRPSPADEVQAFEEHLARGRRPDTYRALGSSRSGISGSGVEDDETTYSEYGKEVNAQMEEFKPLYFVGKDSKNRNIYRAETNTEYWTRRKRQGDVPDTYGGGMGRSEELRKIAGGKKYHELSEEEKPKVAQGVKDAIEDMIGRVMATGDSSRASNNQPLAWEINELMSWLETREDAGIRDLWQARLGSYDQSAVLGSLGKKDGHEQVAGYIPREWLAILFEDKIEFGNYRDSSGKLKQYELSSKYVHAMLQEMVPGAKDREDIWLGRIQGATSLDEVGLAKRRFMAFLMGEQRGVEFAFNGANDFTIVNNPANMERAKSAFGKDIFSIFREVGLGDDGNFLPDDEYKKLEKYDLFATKWFFLNQSITRGRIELTENALERGGNEKGWWAQTINAFRKLHGRSSRDYVETKSMGMTSSRSAVDSYWRSFPAWKMMSKDSKGEYFVIHRLIEGLVGDPKKGTLGALGGSVSADQKEAFVTMFEHIAYMPERFEIGKLLNKKETLRHGYGGELKPTADVRHMTMDERAEIGQYFDKIYGSNNFDWTDILKTMNVPDAKLVGSLIGQDGLEIFLKNYNLNEFIDYGNLSQGFWVDFLSYTQAQGKFWDGMSQLVTNLASPKLQDAAIGIIRSFDDSLANAKSAEWIAKITNEMGMDLKGYESLVDKKGDETSKKWKVEPGDTSEEDLVKALGYRRLSNGHVVDNNGHYVARPGNVPFLKNILDYNAKKSYGSPWIGRDYAAVSWEDKRSLIYRQLKNFNITDPKVWRDVHARFNANMYFGVEFKGNEEPTLRNVIKKLNKEPWRYPFVPLTIMRGFYIDAPIDLATVMAGWSPIGKQLGRILEG